MYIAYYNALIIKFRSRRIGPRFTSGCSGSSYRSRHASPWQDGPSRIGSDAGAPDRGSHPEAPSTTTINVGLHFADLFGPYFWAKIRVFKKPRVDPRTEFTSTYVCSTQALK
jgi:hypothetical protein